MRDDAQRFAMQWFPPRGVPGDDGNFAIQPDGVTLALGDDLRERLARGAEF